MQHTDTTCSCGQEGTQCLVHTLDLFAHAMATNPEYAAQMRTALAKVGATPESAMTRINSVRMICHHCGAPSTKRCGRCRLRRYCSTECQQADWPDHKPHCSVPPSETE